MSAFMVSKQTIDDVVAVLAPQDTACENRDSLGRRLMRMNVAALQARYPTTWRDMVTHEEEIAAYEAWNRHVSWVDSNRFQMLKSCQCLRYQCSEGNVPEEWHEYKQLTEAIHRLAVSLLAEMPEYKAAEWDREEETCNP